MHTATRPMGRERGKELLPRNVAISDCPYRFTKLLCRCQFNAYEVVASTVLVCIASALGIELALARRTLAVQNFAGAATGQT